MLFKLIFFEESEQAIFDDLVSNSDYRNYLITNFGLLKEIQIPKTNTIQSQSEKEYVKKLGKLKDMIKK